MSGTMIHTEKLTERHLVAIDVPEHDAKMRQRFANPDYRAALIGVPDSGWAVSTGDQVLIVGGLAPVWEGRSLAWAVCSPAAGRTALLAGVRLARRWFAERPEARIEATVRTGFAPGIRLAELLGFEREGLMRRFELDHDHWIYARVK